MVIRPHFRHGARRRVAPVLALLFAAGTVPAVGAQVRAPEPMPRQVEAPVLQLPPPVPAHVRPALGEPRVRQAQDQLDARRRVVEAERQHRQRMQTLGATPPPQQAELADARRQQADARRDAALLQERERAAREARARELVDPAGR